MKKKWIDHTGQEIPAAYVPKLDKNRDRVARLYAKKAIALRDKLTTFKEELLEACDNLYDQMLAEHKVHPKTKGGFSVTSFDKSIKIEININERVEFDDRIQVAQELINEYIESKSGGMDKDIRQIVNLAFQTRKGRLDVKRVLGLFQLNIQDKKWVEAMEVLKKSISRNQTKRYARIWLKDKNGEYQAVDLNFSAL